LLVSSRRNAPAAHSFFARALRLGPGWVEVVTDRAPAYPQIVAQMAPAARHITERYANNSIEADHGRFKARLRPMRGLKRLASARTIAAGHAQCRTCAAATSQSPPTCRPVIESASHSTSWAWSSDQ
jgi:transposase, IS6 family